MFIMKKYFAYLGVLMVCMMLTAVIPVHAYSYSTYSYSSYHLPLPVRCNLEKEFPRYDFVKRMYICEKIKDRMENNDNEVLRFDTIKQGTTSSLDDRTFKVIKTDKELRKLWQDMFPGVRVPHVDFGDNMVLAALMGEKSTGGYSIQITKIVNDDDVEVTVKETSPDSDCIVTQATTQPYHLIVMKKSSKDVDFNIKKVTMNC
ncbi:MAG: hypothetical protein RL557_1041 [archaeon]|jgi:hypothetical protein